MISNTARSRSSESRTSRSITFACVVTSSAVVGSSAIQESRDSHASAIAIITRWRIPPENSCGYWGETVGRRGDADLGQGADRPLAGLGARDGVVLPDRFDELELDRLHRVEGAERILEDHSSFPPRTLRRTSSSAPASSRLPGRIEPPPTRPGASEQAEVAEGERRLPGARLADDRDAVTPPDLERRAIDGSNDAAVNRVLDEQVVDREDRGLVEFPQGRRFRPHLHYVAASVASELPTAGSAVTSTTRAPR